MSLEDYRRAEERAFKDSLHRFSNQYKLFCESADLYESLGSDSANLLGESFETKGKG